MFDRLIAPTVDVEAHCDLHCGVYDPAQARIEAESIKAIIGKVADNDDPDFRTRAILIKEQRSELVKHHLWVLWTDYFKPPHFEKYPQLHTLVNEATKLAGASGTKGELDASKADDLLAKIDEIAEIFWETKGAKSTRRPSGRMPSTMMSSGRSTCGSDASAPGIGARVMTFMPSPAQRAPVATTTIFAPYSRTAAASSAVASTGSTFARRSSWARR